MLFSTQVENFMSSHLQTTPGNSSGQADQSSTLPDSNVSCLEVSADALRRAVSTEAVWPAFQPLIDMQSGAIVGFEVLARWTDPQAGVISPCAFIPVAEANGLINILTRKIVIEACGHAATWPGSFILAINISPTQFGDPGLFDLIRDTVQLTGFPLDRIHIEITESALLEDDETVRTTIGLIKSAGMGLSLDDFGTGFASLTRLHAFPFDKLKIDMSFVRAMEGDSGSRKIVASVIGLGQSLGMTVVAEGVETEEQSAMLRRLGCDVGQGWLYGKPLGAADTGQLLSSRQQQPLASRALSVSPFQRHHQLDALYNAAPIGLCFLDTELRHISVNNRFAAMLQMIPGDMIGRTVHGFMPEKEARRVTRDLRRVLAGETVVIDEYQPCGSKNVFLVINQRVDDDAGEPIGVSVTAIDVTDRKTIETALRETEDHARWSIELSPNIPWSSDNKGVVNFMGPTVDGSIKKTADRITDWHDRMHPDDRLRVRQEWLAWLPSGKPFETTFRMRFHDASWRWMVSRARPHRNAGGKIVKWYGVITEVMVQEDLEARIAALDDVHYREALDPLTRILPARPIPELAQQSLTDALANMADGVAIFDSQGYLSFINPQYSRLFPATSDVRQPGTHILDILQTSLDRGEEPLPKGDVDAWKQRVFTNLQKPGSRTMTFSDGRAIEARWGVSKTGSIFVNYSDLTNAKQAERKLTELNERLEALAATDGLTGLANRRSFDEVLEKACAQAAVSNTPISLLMIDVDNFKAFNDTYGHQGGDDCLKRIASQIASLAVTQSIFAARYGGEEIAIVLPRIADRLASMFAQSAGQSIHSLMIPHAASSKGVVTVSIGVGTTPGHAAEPKRLIETADKALYAAKAAGRDCVKALVVTDNDEMARAHRRPSSSKA
jgi:diguanylate cyclase (GGDEF)-like protein/PAS domain S-box-containing protein